MTITNPSVPELLPIGSRVKVGRGKYVWLIREYSYSNDGVLRYVTLEREDSSDRVQNSIPTREFHRLVPVTIRAAA